MPAFLSFAITGLLRLYVQAKLAQIALKIIIIGAIFSAYNTFSQWMIDLIMSNFISLDLPCTLLFFLNELNIFALMNLVLSYLSTMALARFIFGKVGHLI